MARVWTENQRTAIERRGGTILVSAAAGSGKTSVLVQRIIDLITDETNPVDADQLLVVTFTNAAASEMAARVKKELEQRIADAPGNARLRRQALLLGRAQISTVHAFCKTLLKDNFNLLGIPADFALAEDVMAEGMRQQALDRTMDALYADPASNIEQLCDLFGKSRSDRDTERLIDKLYLFESNLAFPEQWEQTVIGELESGAPLSQSKIGGCLFAYAERMLGAAQAMLSEAMELCADDPVLEAGYMPALSDDFTYANRVTALVNARDWDGARQALAAYQPLGLKGKNGADETLKNAAKELRDRSKEILKNKLLDNCFLCTEQQYLEDTARMVRPQRALFHALAVYRETLLASKLERKLFEFSDLERYALQLLCDENGAPTDVARQMSGRFAHVLVDEYQDTNEIQDLIFQLVSRDGKNLFFVGDVKQSIYGFRRADPEIFVARRDSCYDNETGLFPAKIALPHNFRSSVAVIEAINSVFLPIMSRATGGTNYTDPGEQLLPHDGACNRDPVGLELRLITGTDAKAEPRYIAQTIAAMLRAQTPVEEDGATRPCRPADFCILLRSAKDRAKDYMRALEEAGVRCWSDGGDNLFVSSEIQVLLSLLRIIDNPRRDLDLAAAMLSPLFGFVADDLARLRIDNRAQSLYALLLGSDDPHIGAFLETIRAFRARRNALPVGELIQLAVDQLDAEIKLCAGTAFALRRNHIRMLIAYADSFAAAGGSLASFLRLCDSAAQGKTGMKREFSPPDDAVCVTTVHKSKGLEWPFVIVANADKRFNQSDSRDPTMLFDSHYGAGAKIRLETEDQTALYAHKTLQYAALAQLSNEKTTSEEMRVLYVALTRAKQKIIVTAQLDNPDKKQAVWRARSLRAIDYAAATANSWVDWIGLALTETYPIFADAVQGVEVVRDNISFQVVPEVPQLLPKIEQSAKVAAADPARVEAYRRRMAFSDPHAALAEVPAKLAVTALAKEQESAVLYRPAFVRGVSAAERGSAIHIFMQCADYQKARASVRGELERLVAGAYLDAGVAATINLKKLEAFFASDMGRRVSEGRVLREYAFIDAIDAGSLQPLPAALTTEKIMLQGIADCIVLEADGAILVDYKSDRVSAPEQLVERYQKQLEMYKQALDKRLPVPVKASVIYSFELEQAIELPQNTVEASV